MSIHGTLTTMSVPDLLQFLATGRKTGTLKFSRGKVIKEIYFQDGLVVGANTSDPREYLGQVLLHYGKLDESQLQSAMEEQRKTGHKLGEVLVLKGLMTRDSVLEILRIRALDIIYDLFVWEEAQFEFFDSQPLPNDVIRIDIEPTAIIMEGIYRVDELARFRTLIPSERAVLELNPGWTSSLNVSKEVRQLMYFIQKRMSVAEISYNMHDSSFNIYARLFEMVNNGIACVAEEVRTEPFKPPTLAEDTAELLWMARRELKDQKPAEALEVIHRILGQEPKNEAAQALMKQAEKDYVADVYKKIPPKSVPRIVLSEAQLTNIQLGPQEAFLLSRINGDWDVQSILSICPFREADSLRMFLSLADSGVISFS